VASGADIGPGTRDVVVVHPAGRIDIEVQIDGTDESARIARASLMRTARKIFNGELYIPSFFL
jgi:2-methylaconitate cis-trans-isomerase PrpF